jgi:hypothetical protein
MIVCTELQIQKNCGEMQSTAAVDRPWENLLPELLGRVAAMCPNPTDRALPLRPPFVAPRHAPPLFTCSFLMLSDGERHLPSAILHNFGQPAAPYFCQPSDGGPYRLVSLPEGTTCVGSIDGWRRHVPAA